MITSIYPACITKEFSLNTELKLNKKTTAQLSEGKVEIKTIDGLGGFKNLLMNLNHNQCLVYGCPSEAAKFIVTKGKWLEIGKPQDSIPRCEDTFNWLNEPGILMLDYDPTKNGKAFSRDELVVAIREACPELSNLKMLWWPSTSSCIYLNEIELNGIKGQRLYIHVKNAQDIPRTGEALQTYLWAHGHGYFAISKSGAILERSLFDSSVWQSNRIDFAAGAKCYNGLKQNRGEPILIDGEFELLDSEIAIPSPSECVRNLANENKKNARQRVEPQAIEVRTDWSKSRIEELTKCGLHKEEAIAAVESIFSTKTLPPHLIITLQMHDGTYSKLTINEILKNKSLYDGILTLDPLEEDYDGGRFVGKLFLKGSTPQLISFAHGQTSYRLGKQKIRLEIMAGGEHSLIDQVLTELRSSLDVFDFSNNVVTVGENGNLLILNDHSLKHLLGGIFQFWRSAADTKSDSKTVLMNPPLSICKCILALGSHRSLHELCGIITAPTLRQDGTLLNELGYDSSTKLYFDTQEIVPTINQKPSKKEAFSALKTIMKPFEYFPFSGEMDRTIHLAAILTASVRPSLQTAPAFGYDAPTQGSGKTLLAQCVGGLATGVNPDVSPFASGRDDEEVRKRIFAALNSGSRVLIYDNILGAFDSASMASLLTSANYSDRILGKSESIRLPNKMLILLTGNNLSFAGDMPRRVMISRIDPGVEKPFSREFTTDPLQYCIQNRQQIIAAALTLILFYLSSGSKKIGVGSIASFEQWDAWVRQTILYIKQELVPNEFCDVMDHISQNQTSDPEVENLGVLLQSWHKLFSDEKITVAEMLNFISHNNNNHTKQLRNAINEFSNAKELNAKSCGKIFMYRKDKIVNGLKLVRAGEKNGSAMWRVLKLSTDS